MALLTTVHNPFDPIGSREIKEVPSGKPIYAVIDGFYCQFDVVVSLNGTITHDYEYVIKPEDHIGFVAVPGKGGGKNPMMVVAAIALAVATAGASSAASGALTAAGYGATAAAVGGAVAGMAVAMVGGMLINSLLAPSAQSVGSIEDMSSSPTYGWESARNQNNEGVPLPIIYGKAKLVPPVISQYVETSGNKQYLNVLYALNDGEIASVSDIYINGNPIGFYSEVSYDVRLGTNNQSLIPSFDNTRVDTSVGSKLGTSETIRRTSYNNVSAFTVVVAAPAGMYYANNTGGLDYVKVELDIKYRMVGSSAWISLTQYSPVYETQVVWDEALGEYVETNVLTGYASNTVVCGASTSPLRSTFSVDNLPQGQYEISVKRISTESTSSRMQDKVFFESFTEVIYDDFTYPNTALLSIRALATDQLSGSMPTISCVVNRGANTSNPSVAAQNILTTIGGEINQGAFDAWSQWCTSENLECNIVFDSEVNVRDALNMVGLLGRANIIQIGSEFTPLIEKEEILPVQRFLFTMGNIIQDSFREDYLPLSDRSNVVEITYYDASLEYERQSVELYQHGFDESTDTVRKASIALYGCTSRAQAIRHGRFQLNKNRYLTNTVSFEADVDAIACTIGDIIDVSHDVPQWGYSGRFLKASLVDDMSWAFIQSTTVNGVIASVLNTRLMQIDRIVTLLPGVEYGIAVRLKDDSRYTVSISTDTFTETDILPMPNSIDAQRYDLYAFGTTNRVSKMFRVITINRSSDQRRKINAIEYIPEVYNDTTDTIEVNNISDLAEVSYLIVTSDTELNSSGRSINVVTLIWAGQAISWDIYISYGAGWELIENTKNNYYQIRDLPAGTYGFQVGDKTIEISLSVAVVPLPDIQNLTDYFNGSSVTLRWDNVTDIRKPIEYEVRYGNSWENGQSYGASVSNEFTPQNVGSYWFKARYYDSSLNEYIYSESASGITIAGVEIVKNYVAQFDEHELWSGDMLGLWVNGGSLVLSGTLNVSQWPMISTIPSIMYAGGVMPSGEYIIPDEHIVDIGSAQLCSVTCSYLAYGFNVIDLVSNWPLISSMPSIIGNAGAEWSIFPQIAIAGNDGIFGDWRAFIPTEYVGRMFKMRLLFESKNQNISIKVDTFSWAVDVPDRTERGNALSVPAEGITVAYSRPFLGIPNTQITILSAQENDDVHLSDQTLNGFTVQIKNGGVGVLRSINWMSQSY
ncbi:MAG: phage tail protein [Campylobacterota bacterium]